MSRPFFHPRGRYALHLARPLLALSLLASALLGAHSARAATFTVTTRADTSNPASGCSTGGTCSLRDAINVANATGNSGGVNTIVFDAKAFQNYQTIIIKSAALPVITSDLIINGPTNRGAGVTIASRQRNKGYGLLVARGRVNLSALSITGFGVDLEAEAGRTLVQNCAFYDSAIGIGIFSKRPGTLTVRNSTFFGNEEAISSSNSEDDSSSPYNTATVDSCTIVGNDVGISNTDIINLSNSIVAVNEFLDILGPINDQGHNLIAGTIGDLGLDPLGLNDNGGPTPTVALLSSSVAINAGATSLPIDQTFYRRDSQPDIGAFEFINASPTVEEVTPQDATDKVGAKRTFAVTVRDGNGADDIAAITFLINDKFDTNSGVNLLYFPSNGLLYLYQGGKFLPPIRTGSEADRTDVLENGAIRIVGSEVSATDAFAGNNLTVTIPATVKAGLIGKNTFYVRVDDFAAVNNGESSKFVPSGKYTVETVNTNSAPTLSKLAPRVTTTTLFDTGIAPQQTFGFYAQDVDGQGDIREMWFSAGKTPAGKDSATLLFEPRSRRLSLLSDDGTTFSSGFIGGSDLLENNQVRVVLANVKLQVLGDGKSLGLVIPMLAKSGLVGQNTVWLKVKDSSGATSPGSDTSGFVPSGSWLVKAPSPSPSTTSATQPSAGSS
ncbi:hypothetical protein IAD21_00470 [Abditibacteriota bacterium]|nr:hypothetical protein IAD21_00470 [Abditibacteriota bacterium]